jgi:hypothetical protein
MIRGYSRPIAELACKDYGAFHCGLFLSARQESMTAARNSSGTRRKHHVMMARAHHRSLMRALRDWRHQRTREAEYRAAVIGSGTWMQKLLEGV